MKNMTLLKLISVSAVSVAILGCSKTDREDVGEKAASAYETSKSAIADTWNDAKELTFEKSRDFRDRAEAMAADADAKISKLKSEYTEEKASASRSAAMQKLKDAQATLAEKIKALGNATADTWASAKADVIAAAKRVEAAYDDFVADNS